MIEDFILHFSHDGKTPQRPIDRDAAHAVPPEDFHRATLEFRTGVSSLPPAVAVLQAAVLDCFHQAADFAFRLSRMTTGEKFCDQLLALSRACRVAAAAVHGREQGLADSRALRQLPAAPSGIGRPCTSATQALVVLAQDIAREVSQTALDLHAKATGKTPKGIPCGDGKLKVIIKVRTHTLDKEIARRFNKVFVFPDPRLSLVESRLELMGLALVDAAASAPVPPVIMTRPNIPTVEFCLARIGEIRWDGNAKATTLLSRLLQFLLSYPTWPVRFADIAGSVWSDKDGDVDYKRIHNAVNELNAILENVKFPWTFRPSTKEAVVRRSDIST